MVSSARERASSPWPPGHSPFRVKGLVYQGCMAFIAEVVPGGLDALREHILDRALRDFADQQFLAASTYDIFPLDPIATVAAQLTGRTLPVMIREMAVWQASRQVTGIYRLLLRLASPEKVALRFSRAVAQFTDFGFAEARLVERGRVEAERHGVPAQLAPLIQQSLGGYATTTLELNGAKEPRVAFFAPHPEGANHGVPIVALRFHVTWK